MTTFFLTCAVVGGVLLLAQLVLGALGADNHDIGDHDAPSDGLQLLSIRALSAGVAFFGIGGLGAGALRLPGILAWTLAGVLGGGAAIGVAAAMRAMLRFERDASIDIQQAVGLPATVYIPVPAALAGLGKVQLTLKGRTLEYQAVTPDGNELPTGMAVVVVDVRNDDTVEVVPIPSLDGVL